jgi:hypothetical protein
MNYGQPHHGRGTGKIRASDVRDERGGVFAAAFCRLNGNYKANAFHEVGGSAA